MKEKNDVIAEARRLLRDQCQGVLATQSKSMPGYPFGSVSTYFTDDCLDPVFYISDIAQHTRNLKADAKMSLTVYQQQPGDPNAGARLTVIGEAQRMAAADAERISDAYFTAFPHATTYRDAHGFDFYRLTTQRIRYIGGFGEIHWINAKSWTLEAPAWADDKAGMIDHMNADHVDAMLLLSEYHHGIQPEHVKMFALHRDGCYLDVGDAVPLHVPFKNLANSPGAVRKALVDLTQQARAALQHDVEVAVSA